LIILVGAEVVGVRLETTATGGNGARQRGEIFRWMRPALAGEPQCPAGADAGYGRVVDPFGIDADLNAGLVFLFEVGAMTFLRREKKAVHASKIGIVPFVPADRLDAVHGSDLAVVINTRVVLAPNPGQLRIEI